VETGPATGTCGRSDRV